MILPTPIILTDTPRVDALKRAFQRLDAQEQEVKAGRVGRFDRGGVECHELQVIRQAKEKIAREIFQPETLA